MVLSLVITTGLISTAPGGADPLWPPEVPTPPAAVADYPFTVNVNVPDGNEGYIFYSQAVFSPQVPGLPQSRHANIIATKSGKVVWSRLAPPGQFMANFRVSELNGKPVLTWFQGVNEDQHGSGVNYIADQNYNVIRTFTPANMKSDMHEFRILPDGRALVTAYVRVRADLTSIGGPVDGEMYDCVANIIDPMTGRTLFQWSALRHISVSDTYVRAGWMAGSKIPDPYHMNSIDLDPQGNLLISMRHTSAVYNVDPRTGNINWQLGGKRSSFTLGPGVEFAFQHDAEPTGPNSIRLFNNNSQAIYNKGYTSWQWIDLDHATRTATLARNLIHPDGLVSFAMGNVQGLPNGYSFGSYGTATHISEFSPTGEMVFDATLTAPSYRAYFQRWPGAVAPAGSR
ncbi:arylsulfotransferase family protein [Nocardia sp. CDC159]|uniref:Arylsulfotransferase family protein n=1 Tax=Nocardia pulmonis TaxID=2951408 RepID=A0A9X2E522_9NOCA|nr:MULTISPECIES: arylsulfotransferase family protein [Nocardia]MCM6774374.1 arylsulfotransferase family protein [Nocardia pulmonis]MCM6787560.1 arylsulfotransferase family protein [Nocardia sp. CDC159]